MKLFTLNKCHQIVFQMVVKITLYSAFTMADKLLRELTLTDIITINSWQNTGIQLREGVEK